jgi:putative ABC transport system substrate-binding protein
VNRREFITLLGSAAAWPLAARAQQPAMPVIGYLGATSRDKDVIAPDALRQGLKEAGFVEGQNVVIEYRWAEGQYDRLPALASDLVRRGVAVIFAPASTPAALAAKAATTTTPIVFTVGSDPVAEGLVASLARPGGNVTGVTNLVNLLSGKRLEMLTALLPNAKKIAMLMNPRSSNAWPDLRESEAAARALGLQFVVVNASSEREIDAAFARLTEHQAAALFVIGDGFFRNQRQQIIEQAARNSMPASYPWPDFADGGGLMSYGGNNADTVRLSGLYVGRILKGEKPADLPVVQSTKLELVLNLKTAKTLGIEIPPTLLARADRVVE